MSRNITSPPNNINLEQLKYNKWSFRIAAATLAWAILSSIPQFIQLLNNQQSTNPNQPKFTVDYDDFNNTARVIYTSKSGERYIWFNLRELGGDWKAELRAVVISNRLEQLRYEKITEIDSAKKNNENIICVYTEADPLSCEQLVTLPPGVSVESVLPLVQCKLRSLDSRTCIEELKV